MDGMIQQAVEQNVLRAVQQVEDQIDAELHRLENLDEDELEKLRQGRINEMKRSAIVFVVYT
jgi:acetyl-CoA carboxylase alpha subunit